MDSLIGKQVPVYELKPDGIAGNKDFRVYNYEGSIPGQSDLLIPHRKDHYLVVFIRKAHTRQWIDTMPYIIKNNTVYFTSPNNIIVKEGFEQMWSTGIAFTPEFLSLNNNPALSKLPIIQNLKNVHELNLTEEDVLFVEDILAKINAEYTRQGEWQHSMLMAYLTVLLTYLSRIYTSQFSAAQSNAETVLLKNFRLQIDQHYRNLREVSDYASLLNISSGHLSEVIKIQSGKSAIKHIHERMVLEIRRLLFHTDDSQKEIAYNLGFADTSYFNRFFKRETGLTPTAYRDSIRKMYH